MRRLREIFAPYKRQALKRTLGWGGAAIATLFICPSLTSPDGVAFVFWCCALCAGVSGARWAWLAHRDAGLAERASRAYVDPGEDFGRAAPPTTPGSGRLFVPSGPPPESA